MTVAESHRDVRVTEEFAHGVQVNAALNESAGEGAPQIVERESGQGGSFRDLAPRGLERLHGSSSRSGKHEVISASTTRLPDPDRLANLGIERYVTCLPALGLAARDRQGRLAEVNIGCAWAGRLFRPAPTVSDSGPVPVMSGDPVDPADPLGSGSAGLCGFAGQLASQKTHDWRNADMRDRRSRHPPCGVEPLPVRRDVVAAHRDALEP
jgi:hypothetical protein